MINYYYFIVIVLKFWLVIQKWFINTTIHFLSKCMGLCVTLADEQSWALKAELGMQWWRWSWWCLLYYSACQWHYPSIKWTVQKYIYPSISKVHAGSFLVSVIHRTMTWTTRICNVRTWSFLCVRIHTGVLGTPTASQHNIFDSEKLWFFFLVLLTGFEPRVIESWVRRSTNWATTPPTDPGAVLGLKGSAWL